MRTPALGLIALLAACEAAEPLSATRQPIVRGEVDPGDPAVVMLAFPGEGAFCSGTVVSKHIVLTAAHCLFAPTDSEIWFGPSQDATTERIPVIHGDTHPQFDIGMMTMGAPAPVEPIPMLEATLEAYIGMPVRIVGYGVTGEDASDSGLKRQGTTALHHLEQEIMYTGYEGSQTCYGDSGGPNFMMVGGVEHVVGVTSFGTTVCGEPADGAVRTDTPIEWLKAYVEAHEESEPPTVSITSPSDGAQVLPGFEVIAQAADDHSVARVELLVDGTVNDVDESPAYALNALSTVALGRHQIEVRAVDAGGNIATASITVNIGAACATAAECGGGSTCVDGVCLNELGGGCELHSECASGTCGVFEGSGMCTTRCEPGGSECPSGFHCEEPQLAGGSGQCVPGGGPSAGWCATGGRRGPFAAWLPLLVAVFLVRRRR